MHLGVTEADCKGDLAQQLRYPGGLQAYGILPLWRVPPLFPISSVSGSFDHFDLSEPTIILILVGGG